MELGIFFSASTNERTHRDTLDAVSHVRVSHRIVLFTAARMGWAGLGWAKHLGWEAGVHLKKRYICCGMQTAHSFKTLNGWYALLAPHLLLSHALGGKSR